MRGRDGELAVIGECLAGTARGEAGMLLVEGRAGIGKSSLLAEARVIAGRVGVRALFGEASESRAAVPFAPLLDATLDSDPPIGEPESARLLSEQPYWMLHELQGALESAARERPLVVVLDDLHWADSGTLAALTALPARLVGSPILWILARCGDQGRARVRESMARLERSDARRLQIPPLSDQAVAAVVADTVGAEPAAGLLALAAGTSGVPFLLVELLAGLNEENRLRVKDGRAEVVGQGLPRRLTDSMRDRLDRLSGDAAQAIRVASVLGPRFSAGQLAAMLQRRPSAIIAAVDEAMRMDFLIEAGDRLSFRHNLLRQAVRQTLPGSLRRALQREAATVLLESGAAAVEVAEQLADGAEAGDREAIEKLSEAARSVAASDADAAADLSVRALELMSPDDEGRGPLVAQTVVLLSAALRSDSANALGARELAGALPADQEAEVRLALSGELRRSLTARTEDNRRALELGGLTPVLRARHLGWLTYNLSATGQSTEATSVGEVAMPEALDVGDLEARVITTVGLACVDCTAGAFGTAARRIEALEAFEGPSGRESYVHLVDFHYANALVHVGRLDDALRLLDDGVARGRRDRNAYLLESWAQYGSLLRLAAGRLADARAEAESYETIFKEAAAANFTAMAGVVALAEVATRTGDRNLLKAVVEVARRMPTDSTPLVKRYGEWILALAAVMRGDPADAARRLQGDYPPYASPFLPGDATHPPTVARIALAAGDTALAVRAVEAAESFARKNDGAPLVSAIAAHTRSLAEGDIAGLTDVAQQLRSSQRPLLYAAAREDAGLALARAGRSRDAITQISEALDTYLDCEAAADARRVTRLLREHGVRRQARSRDRPSSGWQSLTDSELRVVRLVAHGRTNRDAADRLFLSPHTVSSHLRHAFAKLDINSRVELTRIVVAEDLEASELA